MLHSQEARSRARSSEPASRRQRSASPGFDGFMRDRSRSPALRLESDTAMARLLQPLVLPNRAATTPEKQGAAAAFAVANIIIVCCTYQLALISCYLCYRPQLPVTYVKAYDKAPGAAQ